MTGVDRISDLPESILIDILSLLPTHVAVQTSLLSTKWKYLWKNIYNLSFDDATWRLNEIDEDTRLTSFAFLVNKVLTSLNEQSIEKFSLLIYTSYPQYDATSWISAAISKNAKVLEFVEEDFRSLTQMPCNFYTCKTLEFLLLEAFISPFLPSIVSLPNLKTLRLQYSRDESISELISGCSSLKNLDIFDISHEYVDTLSILSPTLENLSLKYFERSEDDSKIVINAPQLRYLNLYHVETRNFSVENLSLLDEACIELYFEELHETLIYNPLIFDQYSKGVLEFFQQLYNVKTLSLTGHTFQALSHGGVIPRFSRLSKLTVEVEIQLKSLINLLDSCNELQYLTLSLDRHYDCTEGTCWSDPEKVPICFLSSLHTISLNGIRDHGFKMIAYMLENGVVLKTMTIQAYDFEANEKLLQKILNVCPGSEKCQVIYLNPVK